MDNYLEPIEDALAAGRAVEIPLTNGRVAYVDAEDAERVEAAAGRAYEIKAGPKGGGKTPHVMTTGAGRLHRFVLGLKNGDPVVVDHRNGNGFDNRKANLRVATPKENSRNVGARETAHGYKGVSFRTRSGRFEAKLADSRNGRLFCGTFATAEEAALAFDDAVRRLRPGPFERFNFPRPGERGLDGEIVPGTRKESHA